MKTFLRTRLADFGKIWTLAVLLASTAAALGQPGPDADYPTNKAAAEKFCAEGSYAKAHEIYGKVDISFLSRDEARWVAFRFADTQWRSQAATDNSDTTKLDEARNNLEKQIRDLTREDQHDRVWAEVQESLGDFSWTRPNQQNWGGACRIIRRRSIGGPARATSHLRGSVTSRWSGAWPLRRALTQITVTLIGAITSRARFLKTR
jgi:hypothetical protein